MKKFLSVVNALRTIIKYAGIVLVLIDIVSYAAEKIEAYVLKHTAKKVEGDASQVKTEIE